MSRHPRVGVWSTWKSLTETCVGVKLIEVREILREFIPSQLVKPVHPKKSKIVAPMIASGPHSWFQLDTIFLHTIKVHICPVND